MNVSHFAVVSHL